MANYLAALRKVDNGKQLYSVSFGIDALSTASNLLVLRDELVANGWTPVHQGSAKHIVEKSCSCVGVASLEFTVFHLLAIKLLKAFRVLWDRAQTKSLQL
jgi:hypothetical protein